MVKTEEAMKSTANTHSYGMPAAPWIYINDPTPGAYVTKELLKLIPTTYSITLSPGQDRLESIQIPPKTSSRAVVIRDTRSDGTPDHKRGTVQGLKTKAIKAGANFVSVNVTKGLLSLFEAETSGKFDTPNHFDINASPDAGAAIYEWLFTVLTVRETLYLIPDADMRDVDTKLFPEYKYCAIDESRSKPKDAKIQFVALILTKPQVMAGKKLVWTVADKTGVASFYFQHRGKNSEYTWDWVMSLKPGERRALPRMPMVEIKERRHIRVVKAPFRAVAAVVGGTGFVLKHVGKGISKASKAIKMGSSSEWVLEADVDANGKKIDWTQKDNEGEKVDRKEVKETVKVFDEKSEKVWEDGASDASTEAETDVSAEKSKDFL